MKTLAFFLALIALLLVGCSSMTVNVRPPEIYGGETTTVTVALLHHGVSVTSDEPAQLESDNPAVKFSASQITNFTVPGTLGGGRATLDVSTDPAANVTQTTKVKIKASWLEDDWPDSHDSKDIVVHPHKGESPVDGQKYVVIAPKVEPSWTYEYEITGSSTTGSGVTPPDIRGTKVQFQTKVVVTVLEAELTSNPSTNNPMDVTENAGNEWYLAPRAAAGLRRLKIRVTADSEQKNNGIATFTCRDSGNTDYVATVIGPKH